MPPKAPPPPPFTTYKTFILAQERFSVNDTVSVRAPGGGKGDYIAAIERIHTDKDGEVMLDARWYYKPEETAMGRQPWNGLDEVYDSDHTDSFHVRCVNSKCKIVTLNEYEKLGGKPSGDSPPLPVFFCRNKYLKKQQRLELPLPRYCACKQPQNPEYALLSCDSCKEWYFGNCVGVSSTKAASLKSWECPNCAPTDTRKRKGADAILHDRVRNGQCCPWPDPSKAAPPDFGGKSPKRKKGT